MFFLIGGILPKTRKIGGEAPRACPSCGRSALELRRTDSYLSLFFIPLFPVKKGRPFRICAACGTVTDDGGRKFEEQTPRSGRVCHSCGRGAQGDFEYCPYCGQALKTAPRIRA